MSALKSALKGSWALILGSSSGMGAGVGRALAKAGVNIAGAVQLHSSSEDTDKYPLGIEMAVATPAGEHGMIMLGPPGS